MSGYAVSATQLALPDAGLISYGEQINIGRSICEATRGKLLVIGDGDTGFGGSGNLRRTIRGYASAGFAAISIEDQIFPKRCSFAQGLAVEARDAAIERVRAAIAARDEMRRDDGLDLLIVGRTDCRNAKLHGGLEEAIARCKAFAEAGAEVVYAEGLAGVDEMRALNAALAESHPQTLTMLAQVERVDTTTTASPGEPIERALVGAEEAAQLGYTLSLMGLTLLSVAMRAMKAALEMMASGRHPPPLARLPFDELYREVGFEEHYAWEARFGGGGGSGGGSTQDTVVAESTAAAAAAADVPNGWDDDVMCDGHTAQARADWLVANKALSQRAARRQVMNEFPDIFSSSGGGGATGASGGGGEEEDEDVAALGAPSTSSTKLVQRHPRTACLLVRTCSVCLYSYCY